MSNTKQTAVEWLLEQIKNPQINDYFAEEIEQAKQMEKEQIETAFEQGWKTIDTDLTSNTYYTQTYSRTESTQTTQTFKGEFVKGDNGNLTPKNHGK